LTLKRHPIVDRRGGSQTNASAPAITARSFTPFQKLSNTHPRKKL
jgi:hypothetical protein